MLSSLQQWRQDKFGTVDPNDLIGGDLADPDGDGIPNLEEYGTGSDPKVANRSRVPQLATATVGGSTYPAITYRKLAGADAAVTYPVEESANLTTWTLVDQAVNLVAGPADQGDGTALVTYRGNILVGSGKDFLRLRLSAP